MINWFLFGLGNLPAFAVFAWILKNYHPVPESINRATALLICSVLFVLGPIGSVAAAICLGILSIDVLKAPNYFPTLKEWLRKDFL